MGGSSSSTVKDSSEVEFFDSIELRSHSGDCSKFYSLCGRSKPLCLTNMTEPLSYQEVIPNNARPLIYQQRLQYQGLTPLENLEELFTLVACNTPSEGIQISNLRCIISQLNRLGYLNNENYLHWKNENDESPIEVAIKAGNLVMVKVLLEEGDTDMSSEAFLVACEKGNEQVVKLLIESFHCYMDMHLKITCIQSCAKRGYYRILKMLHRAGFPLRCGDRVTTLKSPKTSYIPPLWEWQSDGSLLHIAAGNGHHQIIDYLIEQNADLESLDSSGRKPVHLAVQGGIHCLRRLLQAGVDLEAADDCGHTPLFLAASFGHFGELKSLIQYGAEMDTHNDEGLSALLAAASANHDSIVKYLLEKGVTFIGLLPNSFESNVTCNRCDVERKRTLSEIEEEANWAILDELEKSGNVLPATRLKLHIGVNPDIIFADAIKKGQDHVVQLLNELYLLENVTQQALRMSSIKTYADIIMSYAFPGRLPQMYKRY